ncbi:MAG: hypothetical protein GXN92_03705 [Candidatus Micrarchaeota archaeon]|nr:hypothetical protein [Candidatus Micrarchaeota archaeon]
MPSANKYLLKYDELGLKSRQSQRRLFQQLFRNIERMGGWAYFKEGRLFAEGDKEKLARVFGITEVWDVIESEKDLESIASTITQHASPDKVYKLEVKRADKSYPGTSIEIAQKLASLLHERIKLGVKQYDETIQVEIRHGRALILMNPLKGPGGLPYGSQGKVLLMFSGGLDSPVAGWMLARRGAQIDYLFLSDKPHEDVLEVYRYLKEHWGMEGKLYFVDGREIVQQIFTVPKRYRMVVFKRMLYRVAEKVGKDIDALALATGESLGQVSTQTLGNLSTISEITSMLILRPLIGFNKQEIIDKAREIGTYDLSSKVKERCNLAPDKVSINAPLSKIKELESNLKLPPLNTIVI